MKFTFILLQYHAHNTSFNRPYLFDTNWEIPIQAGLSQKTAS